MIRSRVDLPPPLGPSSAVSWPVGMLTDTSSRATKSPKRLVDVADLDAHELLLETGWDVSGRRNDTMTMHTTDTAASTNDTAYALGRWKSS